MATLEYGQAEEAQTFLLTICYKKKTGPEKQRQCINFHKGSGNESETKP